MWDRGDGRPRRRSRRAHRRDDGGRAAPPRPRRRPGSSGAARRSWSTRGWRSSTSPAATSRSCSEDGAVTRRRQRRDLQPRGAARRARGARPPLRHRLGLRGHRPRATRSTALDCVQRLNGIFAFALWDDAPRAARRRARPVRRQAALLVQRRAPRSRVASEIARAARRAASSRARAGPLALDHYLAWRFVPAPRTLFAGVSKLPAGLDCSSPRAARRVSRATASAPGAPLDDAGDDELAGRAAPSASPTRSSAR